MPGRSRHVYFEDEIRRPEAGRARGQSSRRRSLSTDRVHSVYDDLTAMQGRDRMVGRDAYDQLLRENQFLRMEQRERGSDGARIAELLQQNRELLQQNRDLQRENRELRRTPSDLSDGEGRKDASKVASLRKKVARLEAENEQLQTKAREWKAKAADYRKLNDDTNLEFENIRRREEDALRRLERVRKNFDLKQDANQQLEQQISDLTSALDMERLRRRHF
ncbi:hypothetical protein C8A05DRAFT_35164 [Staphylotrichum tortipilum]|uniref:Uncharacterized protein n=1 Tax=Staphylotrichum tortipilum TaxID=2831512 RepID=A0AAN6MHV2_9PEZI|nr:hypothetical protein C8A05DRAFT_35164 [Staphylotrichum longicolle]